MQLAAKDVYTMLRKELKASLINYFILDKYTSLRCFFGSRGPQRFRLVPTTIFLASQISRQHLCP
eukprot:scaffold28843_cov144-Skeletonema_dohrnii-CCMP3373.AAC.1